MNPSSHELIDISLPLHPGCITYPDNPPVTFEPKATLTNVITKISFGSHSGTHIDAPKHARIGDGKSIDEIPLDVFFGKSRVLDMRFAIGNIKPSDLESKNIQKGERILLKTTNSDVGFESFFNDFVYMTPEGSEYLASKGVILVGIDSLAIKQRGNPDNRPHTNLLEKGIPILEGLDLSKAEEGEYILSAFPLKFIGIDGSPCRAIIRKE